MRQPRPEEAWRAKAAAFTLVELLLTVVLLLLLFGAVVFNYSTLSRGARLDHGADQLETLFRFARAQAAASGRQVRIAFSSPGLATGSGTNASSVPSGFSPQTPPNLGGGLSANKDGNTGGTNAALSVVWEPDPYGAPGQFVPLPEAQSYVDGILTATEVLEVRLPSTQRGPVAWGWNGYSAVADKMVHPDDAGTTGTQFAGSPKPDELPGKPFQIVFFPDGSSDSVDVVIGALGDDDPRKILLSLSGVSGKIRRSTLDLDAEGRPIDETMHGDETTMDGTGVVVDLGRSTGAPSLQPKSP